VNRWGIGIAALCVAGFCLGPFLGQIAISFTSEEGGFTLRNYVSIFEGQPFGRVILNSFIVAGGTTVCCIAIGASAAFALAKLELTGGRLLLGAALAVSMFPPIATVSPLFLILRSLGLRDRLAGLIVPDTTFALPLAIWVLTSFFRQLPDDLYGAARVDGCSPFQAFRKIFLPLSAPGLATTALLVFIFSWNEFLYALTFISSPEKRTVPVAIALFATGQKDPWPEIFAASTVATLPLILLTVVFQRRIISGLTAGAIKG
jgi:multiple sugar transport system permease protein